MSSVIPQDEKKSVLNGTSLIAILAIAAIIAVGVIAGLALNGKVDKIDGKVDNQECHLSEVDGRLDAIDTRLDAADKKVGSVASRLDRKVKDENQECKRQLAYIRGVNPSHALSKLSPAEVEKKLNNGVKDIEPQIKAEFDRLKDEKVKTAQSVAQEAVQQSAVAGQKADVAQKTADTAKNASETALTAVGTVAEQKTGIFGRSVSKSTKKSISAQIDAYWASQGDIKAGAPLE